MLRHAFFLISPAVFIGCASLTAGDRITGGTADVRADAAAPVSVAMEIEPAATPSVGDEASSEDSLESTIDIDSLPSLGASLVQETSGLDTDRFTIKGGWYTADADEISDDGWIVNGSWMHFYSKIFALELELGYLEVSGEDKGVDSDVWGIPIMLNGRVNFPVWKLDLYGGAGIGTIYYDVEAEGPLVDVEDDGFVFGGNAFLGATISLAERVALGLEAKYYATEDADGLEQPLDAFALMLTLGWKR
jgi:hypothetical protein